jgi:uncharacterized membrane protein
VRGDETRLAASIPRGRRRRKRLTAGLGVWLGYVFFGKYDDWKGVALLLACVGGVIGAVAGAAHEVVTALRQRRSS